VSSAILYAAIVAIWIGVLVPRWLRHDHIRENHLRLRRFSSRLEPQADAAEADARAGFSQDDRPGYTGFGASGAAQPGHNTARAGPPDADEAESGQRNPQPERPRAEHDGSMRPARDRRDERRAQVMRGRRRMLWMLLVLTAIAVGLAYLSLAAWWIVVPPTIVLSGYLLLLREAAHADTEARERAAALARRTREAEAQRAREAEAQRAREAAAQRAADAQREQAHRAAQAGTPPGGSAPVWIAHETLSHAEIIDISERVGDQLYDQYADAKLRAVGD
jgi:hypothetical protein